jgi:LPS-assembly lipoprotein
MTCTRGTPTTGRRARAARVVALASALASLAGCGFHLRGQSLEAGNFGNVYVQSRGGGTLGAELRLSLEDAGVRSVDKASDADVIVTVADERFVRSVLSVDPNTGKAREYEIVYRATYSARRRDGSAVVGEQQIEIARDYVFDPDAVLGKSREEDVLREEMRRDAVQQILGRLSRVSG